MRRMTSNNTTHTIRVPFKNCNKVQIHYRHKSFSLGMEWPSKHGDNPNIVINISDTANMDPPAEDVTIHQIDDNDPVEHIQSFLSTTSFNTPLISPTPQDDVTSTTNTSQMIATQIQMANAYSHHNPSVCPSQPLANQNYGSGQPLVFGPGDPNADATFFASRSFTRSKNAEPTGPMNPSPPMGQPIVCECPRPDYRHENNCIAVRSKVPQMIHQDRNGSPMFNRQMNFPPPQMPLPPVSMLLNGGRPASNPSAQATNVGFSPAPLLRPSRQAFVSQPMMPRAPGDINSAYFVQTLQTTPIPPHVANSPVFPTKRPPVEDTATRPVKLPRKRTTKAKTPRLASPIAVNHDQSLPSHHFVGTPESGGFQIPAEVAKVNSPVTNNASPTPPIRPSIRLVPEESSSPESTENEPAKASPAPVSTPTEQRVRSPVRIDDLFAAEEHFNESSEKPNRGVDHIIEQVARNGEGMDTIPALPKTFSRRKASAPSIRPTKKTEQKPPVEGRRKPGRPPKHQQIVLGASAAMPPVTGSVFDCVPHPYSTADPNVCNNNLARITPSCTELVPFDDLLTEEHFQAVANLSGTMEPGQNISWDVNCFQNFDDPYSLSTPAGPMSLFSGIDPSLAFSSMAQSATPLNIYTHLLPNDSTAVLPNGASWQENQVSSSVITPPGSHNSLSAGETSLLAK